MTPEDEAFDDMARKQGMWGGGFNSKRQAAMDKVNSHFDAEYKKMHEDRAMYGTSWSKDGERIDPMSVYLEEPAQEPKREWVGLTPEEINAVNAGFTSISSFHAGALWAQAKLKEKNFD